ncbi:unnamed protein product, partial [Rotaria sp. Silwood1]
MAESKAGITIAEYHESLMSIISIVNDNEDSDKSVIFSIRQIYKNVFILSFAFVLMFTAYSGMAALQSSLNTKDNVGVNSLIITTVFVIGAH